MPDPTTDEFLKAIDYLLNGGLMKSAAQIAKSIGVTPALITEAKKGRTNINPTI